MKVLSRLRNSGGFTLVEVIVVVTILGILTAIFGASYDAFQARIRFTQVRVALETISQAAYLDLTSNRNNEWADMVPAGSVPSFVVASTGTLQKWPSAPCPGWSYTYDNYFGIFGVNSVRVSVRRANLSPIWTSCLENYGGNCQLDELNPPVIAPDISTVVSRYVYCSE